MAWFRPDAPCRNDSEVTLSRYASLRNRAIGRGVINDPGVRTGTCEALEQPRRAAWRSRRVVNQAKKGSALAKMPREKQIHRFARDDDES
jgi:hypothetical protein